MRLRRAVAAEQAPDEGHQGDVDGAGTVNRGARQQPGPGPGGRHLFGRGMLYVLIWSMQIVVGVVVSPVLAHTLGPAEFGSLASAIALYQLLIVLAVCGLDQALQVERAGSTDARNARGILASAIVLTFVVAGVAAVTAQWWGGWLGFGQSSQLVWIVLLWTAPGGAVLAILGLLQSEDRLGQFALVSVLSSVGGQVLGLAAMWWWGRNAEVYAWGGVASQFLAFLVGLALTRPRLRGLADGPVLRRAIRLGVPLMLTGLSIFVLNVSDRLVTQRLLGAVEVGRFQVAYTLGYVLVLILSFTNRAWIPMLAQISDNHDRWLVIRESRDGIFRLLMPAILGMTLAAPVLLRVVAPPSFRPDSLLIVVYLVAMAAFPVTAVGASSRMLITLRNGRALAWSAGGGVAVKLGMNVALVPLIGISGAAIATVLALSAQAAIQSRSLPSSLGSERPTWKLVGCCVLVCMIAAGTTVLPQSPEWNAARFALGLLCLPWFWIRLRNLRRGTSPKAVHLPDAPVRHAATDEVDPRLDDMHLPRP